MNAQDDHYRLKKPVYQTQTKNWRYIIELPTGLITKAGYETPGVKAGLISHLTIIKITRLIVFSRNCSHRLYGIPKCVAPGELPEGRRHYRTGTLYLKKVRTCAYW